MYYKINIGSGFSIVIKNNIEELDSTIVVATNIKNDRPSAYVVRKNTRDTKNTVGLAYKDSFFTGSLLDVIDFVGYLKFFVHSKLNSYREYIISNYATEYKCQVVDIVIGDDYYEKGLKLTFPDFNENISMDKITVSNLADKIQKIISKCEISYFEDSACYER